MAAYAAIARIGRVDPHLAIRPLDRGVADLDPPTRPSLTDDTVAVDVIDASPVDALAERVTGFRERWGQLTFFLLDPESWRT